MYCVKFRDDSETDSSFPATRNGRSVTRGKCAINGTTRCQSISAAATGGDPVDSSSNETSSI